MTPSFASRLIARSIARPFASAGMLLSGSVAAVLLTACADDTHDAAREHRTPAAQSSVTGTELQVRDTALAVPFEAAGVAEPVQQATVSTKLMGSVTAVLVQEGQMVRAGQPLVRIDARDLDAKSSQLAAAIADAEALQKEAATHAARFTALYQDSAATRAQYDAAMTGLARADAGLRAARASAGELDAVRSYATVRAPFDGMVVTRMVDAGSFAAPGAPLLTLQDISSLRLSVAVPADVARPVIRGQKVRTRIDGDTATTTIEGVVPGGAGDVYTINALLPNARQRYRAGGAVSLVLETGSVRGLAVPLAALVRDGDLIGVIVRQNGIDTRRWIRTGATIGSGERALIEVTSGLKSGETIVLPSSSRQTASRAVRAGGI